MSIKLIKNVNFQLSRYDPLPKVICLPCDAKLEQHHRFIQRVIQNQKKIQGNRPIIPLLEQHLRVRVREDESNSNTYNIEALSSSSDSETSSSDSPSPDDSSEDENEESHEMSHAATSVPDGQQSTSNQPPVNVHSSSSHDEERPLAGFNSELEPVILEDETDDRNGTFG